jgi:hypothetical protein
MEVHSKHGVITQVNVQSPEQFAGLAERLVGVNYGTLEGLDLDLSDQENEVCEWLKLAM